jgi:hypothetical protein
MTIVSDLFGRAPETPVGGPTWQSLSPVGWNNAGGSGLNLSSNALVSPGATDNISAVNTTAYPPNKTQFAEVKLTTVNTSGAIGPAVNLRNGTGRCNGFGVSWDDGAGALSIFRWTGNFEFYSVSYSISSTISVNDVIRLECTDNNAISANTVKLRIYKNGTLVGAEQTLTFEDSFGAGQIGVWSSGAGNGVIDEFNGGDLITAATSLLVRRPRINPGILCQ